MPVTGMSVAGNRTSGFSAVELLCSIVIMTAVSISLLAVFSSSSNAVAEISANTQVDAELLRVIDRLHSELDFVDPDQVDLIDPKTVRFAAVTGWDGFQTTLGPARTLQLVGDELQLDGIVLLDGVVDMQMAVAADMLAIQLDIEAPYTRNGNTATVRRTTTMIHKFGS